MTKEDKQKIEKLKERFRRATSPKKGATLRQKARVLFPGNDRVNPVPVSFSTRNVPIYRTDNQSDRHKVLNCLQRESDKLIREKYGKKTFTGDHTANIAKLADKVSKECGKFLYRKRLRFGIVQKYLNLKLKGLWVLNKIKMHPPHCPFDAVILEKVFPRGLLRGKKTWTASDSRKEYEGWVKAAQNEMKEKGYPDLAVWELAAYNYSSRSRIPHWKDIK